MKKAFLFLCIISSTFVKAQSESPFYLEVDFQSKFTLGNSTSEILTGEQVQGYVNKQLSYPNPVYQIAVLGHYSLNNRIAVGLGAGMNFSKNVGVYMGAGHYDKTSIPLFLNFKCAIIENNKMEFNSSLNLGYQFTENYLDYFYDRWSKIEYGGLLAGIDLQFVKKQKKYSPFLRIGYEYNQFNNQQSFGWYSDSDSYMEDFQYRTFCHLIKAGVGLKI